jgi:uncharacterized protein
VKILVTNFELSVCKLIEKKLPEWAFKANFLSYTLSPDEISVVCDSDIVPAGIQCETGWACFKIDEILDFSMIGVIAKISNLLANSNISIFVISTYNTDYILLKKTDVQSAINILQHNDFEVI